MERVKKVTRRLNEAFYRIKDWWHILGLVLLGLALIKTFNLQILFYLFLASSLIAFGHAFDDRKRISLVYLIVIILMSFDLSVYQIIIEIILLSMFVLYSLAKYYPISAFYKGFGWSLLFLLPVGSFNLWYIPISLLASTSEIIHEANHFEQDKKEGRFTTAHLLNFKTSKEGRKKWRLILIAIGFGLLFYFYLR